MRLLAPTLLATLALLALAVPAAPASAASSASAASAAASGDVPVVSRPYGRLTTGTSVAGASASGLARLIAPPRACPGQMSTGATSAHQERVMLCMTNFARRQAGRRPMRPVGLLFRSAALKSRDILRCDRFDHSACGRDFSFWMRRVGYLDGRCWRAAENIAYGTGPYASVRSIFRGWIQSQGHRENILGPTREIGIGLRVGSLEGSEGAHVWTQHFGTRC